MSRADLRREDRAAEIRRNIAEVANLAPADKARRWQELEDARKFQEQEQIEPVVDIGDHDPWCTCPAHLAYLRSIGLEVIAT
jgi:hypothetical protein